VFTTKSDSQKSIICRIPELILFGNKMKKMYELFNFLVYKPRNIVSTILNEKAFVFNGVEQYFQYSCMLSSYFHGRIRSTYRF